ncbi:peroxidase family protein [Pleurocapsales cyanobacterium LEGE 10410]|nr:peroxidase family protein [Pleurocapsales cyanobacterium LEGE 10410]
MKFLPEYRYRSYDGSQNNLRNFNFGKAGENLSRQATPAYADGVAAPAHPDFPNPRLISNMLSNQTESILDERNLSSYVWTWGQFITHDLVSTLRQTEIDFNQAVENISIPIPEGDPVYQPGSVIPVTRSVFDPSTGNNSNNPRQHTNGVTSWLDGSVIYGSDPQRANWLRSFEGGQLKVSSHESGDLLPILGTDPNAPEMDSIRTSSELFVAGDTRANENPALTSFQTLFVREHNRIAQLIDTSHTDLPTNPIERDEEIYQRTRKIVSAQLQSITYNEFLPALGVTLDPYTGYNSNVDASIKNEFATLGFRLGHSQSGETIPLLAQDGSPVGAGEFNLAQSSFDPSVLTSVGGIEPILLGLVAEVQEATDLKIVDSLRNILFTDSGGNSPVANGTDLAALDIQRGRDHGLPSYNDIREAYGLDRASSFEEITNDPIVAENLATVYSDVEQIDPLIGMLAEGQLAGASIGELNEAILEEQFERLRDGDRFWYQNDSDFVVWDAPEPSSDMTTLEWLSQLSLSDIIELNSEIDFPDNPFFAVDLADFSSI